MGRNQNAASREQRNKTNKTRREAKYFKTMKRDVLNGGAIVGKTSRNEKEEGKGER